MLRRRDTPYYLISIFVILFLEFLLSSPPQTCSIDDVDTPLRTVDSIFIWYKRENDVLLFFRQNVREKVSNPVNKVCPVSSRGSHVTSSRVFAITSDSTPPPPLIVSSCSTLSSIDVISRWPLHGYILCDCAEIHYNKLNICFNSLSVAIAFPSLRLKNIPVVHV